MNTPKARNPRRTGYLYVMLAAFLWASSGTAAKFLFNSGVTSFQLVQMRLTVATVVLSFGFALHRRELFRIAVKDIPYFMVLGFGAMACVQFTYLLAISRIQVAAAILLQYLAPSMIAVYAFLSGAEKLTKQTLLALAGATFGCYLVVGGHRLDVAGMDRVGIIAGVLSAVTFAWYSLQGEYGTRKYPAWTVLFYAIAFAAIPWNIFLPPLSAFTGGYSTVEWGLILYIGVMGTALPFGFYLKGTSMIRATRASITATLEPILAGVISFFLLGETMGPVQVAGGTMVILSIVIMQLKGITLARPRPIEASGIKK